MILEILLIDTMFKAVELLLLVDILLSKVDFI